MAWDSGPGIVELPDGARVRGRGLRAGPPGSPFPEWGLYLLPRRPVEQAWSCRWVRWPDFWLPLDRDDARSAFEEAHRRALAGLRVEVVCGGGVGRTGAALACIAQLGGVDEAAAIDWVRERYRSRAVETPWQQRYVRRFAKRALRRKSPARPAARG